MRVFGEKSFSSSTENMISCEEDRISNIPDEILIHMLCFLETNHAIRTGTLLKRWKNLWCHVTSLTFDISKVDTSETRNARLLNEIMNFINSRCSSPLPGCFVRKFSLANCIFKPSAPHNVLEDLLNSVLGAGVQYLCVEHPPGLPLFEKLPEVFLCETLVDLKLRGHFLQMPDSVNLPNLKTLYLRVSRMTPDVSEKLFTCCPNLESLTMLASWINLPLDGVRTVLILKIFAPKLKHLAIGFDRDTKPHNVVVKAPLLRTLHISGILGIYRFLNSSYSFLVEAGLDIFPEHFDRSVSPRSGGWLHHILEKFSSVQSLKISRCLSKPIDYCIRCGSLSFPNLTRLELNGIKKPQILGLLELTPSLEYLKLSFYGLESVDEVNADAAPSCLLSRMKGIEVEESRDWRSRWKLMEYFMKNGKVLEKMVILFKHMAGYEDDNHVWDDEIRSFEIEMLKDLRGSSSWKFEFLGPSQITISKWLD